MKRLRGDGAVGLVGCPPCQGWSAAGLRKHRDLRNRHGGPARISCSVPRLVISSRAIIVLRCFFATVSSPAKRKAQVEPRRGRRPATCRSLSESGRSARHACVPTSSANTEPGGRSQPFSRMRTCVAAAAKTSVGAFSATRGRSRPLSTTSTRHSRTVGGGGNRSAHSSDLRDRLTHELLRPKAIFTTATQGSRAVHRRPAPDVAGVENREMPTIQLAAIAHYGNHRVQAHL